MIGMNSLKQLIRCEMREKLNTCYQENRGKIEGTLSQLARPFASSTGPT